MGIKSRIQDGEGTSVTAGVTSQNALKVAVTERNISSYTPSELIATFTNRKQFRAYFQDENGSRDHCVDGSSTPISFCLQAEQDKVNWVTQCRLILNGTELELGTNDFRRYGAAAIAPGLTNGCEFVIGQGGLETHIFAEPVKAIGDYMSYQNAWENFVNAISAQSDFLLFDFIFPRPIALVIGVFDQLAFRINDDLTAIDVQYMIASGYQELF